MKYPKIKIFYNHLLDPFFIGYAKQHNSRGWNRWTPPTKEKILERVKERKKEWRKYEKQILVAICEITELEFERNVIDVNIISGCPRDTSLPLIISSHNPIEQFVNTLTHELIHKLFSDSFSLKKISKTFFQEMFPNETKTVQNHIMVHAILKYIYLDVLKDKNKLDKNLEKSKKHAINKNIPNDYARSWEIVEEKGYLNLIEDFRKKITLVS
jgi:hypothetical protein